MASNENKKEPGSPEWEKFKSAMQHIVSVPYSEIKAHRDREKEAKKLKRTRRSRYRAFRAVNKTD